MRNNLTRMALAKKLAGQTNQSIETAKSQVDFVISALADALVDGRNVELRHFGTLAVVTRKPRLGRNPRQPDSTVIQIPSRKTVRLRLSNHLIERLNA